MNKQTFKIVKDYLTTHCTWSNGTYYSLNLIETTFGDFEYYRIIVYPNSAIGSFHDGYASFFCHVAEVTGCSCSFASQHGVCVCRFY